MTYPWLAWVCAEQGHIVTGVGTGTWPENIVWATFCHRCGAPLTASGKAKP